MEEDPNLEVVRDVLFMSTQQRLWETVKQSQIDTKFLEKFSGMDANETTDHIAYMAYGNWQTELGVNGRVYLRKFVLLK